MSVAPESHWWNFWGYQTPIAEWASILALFISLYAAITIARVRSQILGRVRLPTLVADLEKKARSLSEIMRDYEMKKEQFDLELRVCEANLKILNVSIKGRTRSTVKALRKAIKRYRGQTWFSRPPTKSRAEAWEIYSSLNAMIEELKHALEDQRIGG